MFALHHTRKEENKEGSRNAKLKQLVMLASQKAVARLCLISSHSDVSWTKMLSEAKVYEYQL